MLFLLLQGFSIQNLTPNEAAAVLFRAEECMGKAIPEELKQQPKTVSNA